MYMDLITLNAQSLDKKIRFIFVSCFSIETSEYCFQLLLHENMMRFFKIVCFLKRKACGYPGWFVFTNKKCNYA